MLEILKQNKGIESGRDAQEPESKQRDLIRARCSRTQNKRKGSNLGMIPENTNQKKGSNVSKGRKEGAMP